MATITGQRFENLPMVGTHVDCSAWRSRNFTRAAGVCGAGGRR